MNTLLDRARGCLFGLAIGDALAAPTEFLPVHEIITRWPPHGPKDLSGNPSRVTDDTQMSIAVAGALVEVKRHGDFSPQNVEYQLRRTFVEWLNSPDNNRAPGMTCLTACENLERGKPWLDATVSNSKGCGANMRVAPVGLLPLARYGISEETRAALAQFQAAVTHGHPTALVASDLTAFTIAELIRDNDTETLCERLRDYATAQREVYHEMWLTTLWVQPVNYCPEDFISRGWDECIEILDRLDAAVRIGDTYSDPCEATGDGWVAEEAFGTGLLCFLLFPDDPVRALQRAAVTRGDSDSIACLTGAFAGAAFGAGAWPQEWFARIEYADRLEGIAVDIVR